MRILLICPSYFPVLGGVQSVTRALAGRLIQLGHEVRVISNRFPRTLPASELIDGAVVHRWLFLTPRLSYLKSGRLDLFFASFFYFPLTLSRLIRSVKTFRPDVVHFHYPESQTVFVRILRRFCQFKLIVTFHAHDIQKFFESSAPNPEPLKRLLRAASGITACSQNLFSRAVELEPSIFPKARVIGNGIDRKRFETTEVYRHSRPYLFASGRLTPVKGFDLLIDAFSKVAAKASSLDLVIAGSGEEKERLTQLITRLGLADRVHLIGRVSSEDIVKLLNGCEFAVVPSRNESFGIVALEAMAAGKAVLATRVGGLPEFLFEPVNQLVESTVQGLAEGLGKWTTGLEEVKKRGEENRKEAFKHTLDQMVESYLRVYEKA